MAINPFRIAARAVANTGLMRFMARSTDKRMAAMGLFYDDLIIETPTVARALSRLSPEETQARQRRLKRAIDMDNKHVYLPEDQQVNPRQSYLMKHILDVEALEAERAELDMD